MAREDVNAHATKASRAKGGKASSAKQREDKARRAREAEERFLSTSDKAIDKLHALLDAEDEAVQLRAAMAILDRALGKPQQRHLHGGALELDVQLSEAKGVLAARLAQVRGRDGAGAGS